MTAPTVAALRPGDVMFGPIGDSLPSFLPGPLRFMPGTWPVGAGQILMTPRRKRLDWRKWWRLRHAATVVHAWNWDEGRLGFAPLIGQAMPSGYEVVELRADQWTPDYVFIRPRYAPGQGDAVAGYAREMAHRHIRYGFVDYAAMAAHHFRLPVPHVDRMVTATDADGYPLRAQCARAVDAQLTMAGFKVYDDGRAYGDVYPSGLYLRLMELGPELVIHPQAAPLLR